VRNCFALFVDNCPSSKTCSTTLVSDPDAYPMSGLLYNSCTIQWCCDAGPGRK